MVKMRATIITLFLMLSVFLVASCFVRKANNKPELTYTYVLHTINDYDISFRFRQHLEEYKQATSSLKFMGNNNNFVLDVLDGVKSIAINVYQTCKLIALFLVDTLRVGVDIMFMLADFIGLVD